MKIDMTKVANVILYMLHKNVPNLNDKKLAILMFLIDYNHQKFCSKKIFGDEYRKSARHPEPIVISELFDIIANEEDLEEGDERLYLIQELLDYIDIEVEEKEKFIELRFLKMEEEYDESLFDKDELRTIQKILNDYSNMSPRNMANATFKIDVVRQTQVGEKII